METKYFTINTSDSHIGTVAASSIDRLIIGITDALNSHYDSNDCRFEVDFNLNDCLHGNIKEIDVNIDNEYNETITIQETWLY